MFRSVSEILQAHFRTPLADRLPTGIGNTEKVGYRNDPYLRLLYCFINAEQFGSVRIHKRIGRLSDTSLPCFTVKRRPEDVRESPDVFMNTGTVQLSPISNVYWSFEPPRLKS